MPRRNRNVHTLTIDLDKLADQARQLTTELTSPGQPVILRTCIAEWVSRHRGGQVRLADAKAVTPDGR